MLHRHLNLFRGLLCVAFLAATFSASVARAQAFSAQMVGGEYFDLTGTNVAFISTTEGSCTGILVGRKEVLTAAHCISGAVEDYKVLVGGAVYFAAQAWYNRSYQYNGSIDANSRYDLGMIELSQPVTGAKPLPVLADLSVLVGDSLDMAGYGITEDSGITNRDPWDNGKVGKMVVTEKGTGTFSSEHATGGASSCAGDSGGPAVEALGPYFAVVGILSAGTNRDIGGSCTLAYGGQFTYVDLQSQSSRDFLSYFPGVQYLSANRVAINLAARRAIKDVTKALRNTNLGRYKKAAAAIRSDVAEIVRHASGKRKSLLSAAVAKLQSAQGARTLSEGVSAGRAAKAQLAAVVRLGV